MDKIIIQGGYPLYGDVSISGAKNAVLPILFSAILTDEKCSYKNVPDLRDVTTALLLLKEFGIHLEHEGKSISIRAQTIEKPFAPYELVRTMRASVLALGPLLARTGMARIALPGGCAIGARPINLHLQGLTKLGADISLDQGYVMAKAKKLKGAHIYFEMPTVTGTENLMMAACLAEGTTIIENAAKEPEIIDLANCLNSMGAHIEGAGNSKIIIEGKRYLKGTTHEVMFDRIEAGTYLVAGAVAGGDITVSPCDAPYMQALLSKLEDAGASIEILENHKIRLKRLGDLRPVNVRTEPYPGFPTDMQAQMMVLATLAQGSSTITETIFENRFMHVCELQRMGAQIDISGNTAVVKGGTKLLGAPVMATDLRASVCLVIAGLAGEGITEIQRVYHLDRGYEALETKFQKLGAHIERVSTKRSLTVRRQEMIF